MSSVPYTFANSSGNIPLAHLDANFSNVKAFSDAAGTAGTVTTAAQPNITSIGTLSSLTVTANVTASNFVGNFVGNITNALTAGTVTTAAQPNITSVGVLSSLIVSGNITSSGGTLNGSGAGLSNLPGANVTGAVANATYATSAGSATTATSATSATTAGTVTTAAQPNITSVGTLSSLSVTGNISSSGVVEFGTNGNGFIFIDGAGFAVLGADDTTGAYLSTTNATVSGVSDALGVLIATNFGNLTTNRTLNWNNGNLDLDLNGTAPGNIANVRTIGINPVALSTLTPVAGARAFINNGNLVASGNFGAQVGGGGANTVPVWSDGTNWYIG